MKLLQNLSYLHWQVLYLLFGQERDTSFRKKKSPGITASAKKRRDKASDQNEKMAGIRLSVSMLAGTTSGVWTEHVRAAK